jgi:hypothetical protein
MLGLGDFAARIPGEIGNHLDQYGSPDPLQCYVERALATRRPLVDGVAEVAVLGEAAGDDVIVFAGAFCSLTRSGWVREFYDSKTAASTDHHANHANHATLRALGSRRVEVLWHCLRKGISYNETVHVASRNHALGAAFRTGD